MVSALDFGSKGPGSSPDRVIVLCSWARHFTLTVPLSTQEYNWVPVNCQGNLTKCWGVTCDGLASHPGGVAILLVASCYGNRDKLRRCGPLGSCARLKHVQHQNTKVTVTVLHKDSSYPLQCIARNKTLLSSC